MDLAASIQFVLDEVVLRLTWSLSAETGARNLCLAGGVALNCVTNGKVLRDGRFEKLWIQPASGDARRCFRVRRWRPTTCTGARLGRRAKATRCAGPILARNLIRRRSNIGCKLRERVLLR